MKQKTIQCCTFYVNGYFFGVDVLKVREVIRYQHMTKIPLAPEIIQGLINLRGEIVTAIDLRRTINTKSRNATLNKSPMNVVIMTDESPVSLLVDEIGDVVELDSKKLEEPPQTIHPSAKRLVDQVYKMDDRLMLILNVNAAIDVDAAMSA
jgi:purine-binding chemotaxis protein CheW